jgi:membrane-associated phospholipid phosphatase
MSWLPDWVDVWTKLSYPRTFWFLVILTVSLVVLSILVRARATLAFDLKATRWLQNHHTPLATRIANGLTWLGNSLTLTLLAVGVFAACMWIREFGGAWFTLLSLLAMPINTILKNLFDRERPGEEFVQVLPGPRWGFSYPSGHAMAQPRFTVSWVLSSGFMCQTQRSDIRW